MGTIDRMDRVIPKKHPVLRYKYYILAGIAFLILLIFVIFSAAGPKKLRYEVDKLGISEVEQSKFLEYLDTEGVVLPILTIRLNALEGGIVDRIVSDDGDMLKLGDTILVLTNPELIRTIDDDRDDLEKKRITHRENLLEMERKSSQLKRQSLETVYKMDRLGKQYALDQEEYNIGIKSKAQLEVASDEYQLNEKTTKLLLEEMKHDSLMNVIQKDLMKNDLDREEKRFRRSAERLDNLIVRAPIAGQLSFVSVIPGERINLGSAVGELKVIDQFKLNTKISEYYIDRVTVGLPATIIYQGEKYPLKISKINPEIKDRQFSVDFVFTDLQPENIRIGKNYRIQIELGSPEDALVISKGNFFQTTGGQWIFKLNESGTKATKVPVSIGRQNPQQYEITGGLKSGDKVIVAGYDNFGDAEEIILK